MVEGAGVRNLQVVDAFDMKSVRSAIRSALDSEQLSVVIVRGKCAVTNRVRKNKRVVDQDACNDCGICLMIGCPAIQKRDGKVYIEADHLHGR